MRRRFRLASCLALALVLPAGAAADEPFGFDALRELAKQRAAADYRPPYRELPRWLSELDYDGYRNLRFRPETSLWRDDGVPFIVQFLHRGYLFHARIPMHVVNGADVRELSFDAEQFDYTRVPAEEIPDDLGYSGFAARHPMNAPDSWDEFVAFHGASYFRMIGAGQHYGASARGLAIDTASPDGEEFPEFVEFWLEKPLPGAQQMTVLALLDSPSTAGAYRFVIHPGPQTVAEVSACLYPRTKIAKLGLSPLTGMFLFGETGRREFADYRPEVHDCDGVLVASQDGNWTWRPLVNPAKSHRITRIPLNDPKGFGLLQRDRRFADYQDLESRFETRPSYWVAPQGAWGRGHVELVEIPTKVEWNDNIVVAWVPESTPEPGTELRVDYVLSTYLDEPSRPPLGRAVDSRTREDADGTFFVVDFAGPQLAHPADEPLAARVEAERGEIRNVLLQPNDPIAGQRCTFLFAGPAAGPEGEPTTLKAWLVRGERRVSETWMIDLERP